MKKVVILISLSTFVVTIGLIFLFTGRTDSIFDRKSHYYYETIKSKNSNFNSALFNKFNSYPIDINLLDDICNSYTIGNKFYHYVDGNMTTVGASELVYGGIDSFASLYVHNNTGHLKIACDDLFKIIIPTDDKYLGETYKTVKFLLDNKHFEIVGDLSSELDDKSEFDMIIKESGRPTHIYKLKDKELFYYIWESDSFIISFIINDSPEYSVFEIEEIHYIPVEYYSLEGLDLEEVK